MKPSRFRDVAAVVRRLASGVITAATPRHLFVAGSVLCLPALSAAIESRSLLETAGQAAPAVVENAVTRALAAPIVTVVDKAKPSPTGDNHDYISYARYYWPDPKKPDGLPFIPRDGHHNREQVAAGDRHKIDLIVDNVSALALGWSRLHREDCARRAGDWLRAWFVTPATRMKPALDYAQVRLGHDQNRGNATGLIDTRTFAQLVEAIGLLQDSPALTAAEGTAVRQWFSDYYGWLGTGKSAVAEHAARNNHATWFLVQAVAIARFLGRDDDARRLGEEAKGLIARQFEADGRQPLELARADGLHYSHFNLYPHLQLARMTRPLGVDLWHYTAPNGGSLKRGLEFLVPYNAAPEKWPYKQKEAVPPGFMNELLAMAAELDAAKL